jgi:hypothetical protein
MLMCCPDVGRFPATHPGERSPPIVIHTNETENRLAVIGAVATDASRPVPMIVNLVQPDDHPSAATGTRRSVHFSDCLGVVRVAKFKGFTLKRKTANFLTR